MLPTQSLQSLCLASARPAEPFQPGKGSSELHILVHPYFTGNDQLAARYLQHARGLGSRDFMFLLTHFEPAELAAPSGIKVKQFFGQMKQLLGERLFVCHESSEFSRIDSASVSAGTYLRHVFSQQQFPFTPETATYFMGESFRSCVAATAKGFVKRLQLAQPATILLDVTDDDGYAQKPPVIQERIRHDFARYGLHLLPPA